MAEAIDEPVLLAPWLPGGDPVEAWAEITADPERTTRYENARSKGGFVRAICAEVSELGAAAQPRTDGALGMAMGHVILTAFFRDLWFLWLSYIVYRSRFGIPPNEPGTGGRAWRGIGTPY